MATPSRPQDFKKKLRIGEVVELPSGLHIKVKGVDLTSLVTSGKIPNSLLSSVQSHIDKLESDEPAKGASEEEQAEKLMESMNADELKQYFEIMDSLVISMAMDPEVHSKPPTEADRSEELLYIDELSSEDKLFLFNWAQGGTRSMKRFPGGPEAGMAPMEEVAVGGPETSSDDGAGA